MGILRQPRSFARQPPTGVARLASGLGAGSLFYIPGDQSFANTGLITEASEYGITSRATNTSNGHVNLGKVLRASPGNITYVVQFIAGSSTDKNFVHGLVEDGTSYIEDLILDSNKNEQFVAGKIYVLLREADNAANKKIAAATVDAVYSPGDLVNFVVRLPTANSAEIWVNGVNQSLEYQSSSTIAAGVGETTYPLTIVARSFRGTIVTSMYQHKLLMWARILSKDVGVHPRELSMNPWLVLQRRPLMIPTIEAATTPALSSLTASNLTATGARLSVDLTF